MSSNKISLGQAMADLKGMFPAFDESFLKSVLYKTNGHMERLKNFCYVLSPFYLLLYIGTVEMLLQMQAESEFKRNVQIQESVSSGQNDLAVFPEEKRVFPTLPKDFLIYDSFQPQSAPVQQSPSTRQISEDEKLAMQLQRQMALEESLVASGLIPAPTVRRQAAPQQNYQNRIGSMHPQQQPQYQQQPASSNPLSKFAESTKKKLAEFRAKFGNTNRNNRTAQASTRNGVPPPATGAGPEYSSLLQDDDDDEWNQRL